MLTVLCVIDYGIDFEFTWKLRNYWSCNYNNKVCCLFFFFSVDATKETSRLGRLINHSKNGNLQPKVHDMNGVPHLIFLASRDLKVDEELLYDYGDRSKEATAAHPWLKH